MNDDFNENELGLESFENGKERAEYMIQDIEGDIQDVMNGNLKDMEHADAIWKILDKTALLDEISEYFATQNSVELVNGKSIEEINQFLKDCDSFIEKYKKFKGEL